LSARSGESRRADRNRVLISATVVTPDGPQRARIRNLSSGGAQISCNRPPLTGGDVILKWGDMFLAAQVIWTAGTEAGVEFYRPLDLTDLATAVQPAPRKGAGQ
jgi:hypothetical protein